MNLPLVEIVEYNEGDNQLNVFMKPATTDPQARVVWCIGLIPQGRTTIDDNDVRVGNEGYWLPPDDCADVQVVPHQRSIDEPLPTSA